MILDKIREKSNIDKEDLIKFFFESKERKERLIKYFKIVKENFPLDNRLKDFEVDWIQHIKNAIDGRKIINEI